MGQILVEGGKPEGNLARAAVAVEKLAGQGCRLVVLPECLNLGWTDTSAPDLAEPIPGAHVAPLAEAARKSEVFVAAGLVERAGARLYNAAVLLDPQGNILLHHRKINELDLGRALYFVGDRLGVVDTPLGRIGLNICADNFGGSLAIGHVLARMGAQVIVSPSAWAVPANHDHEKTPYGQLWKDSYGELCRLYDITVVGVSNVGPMRTGPWAGRKCIGCSLAMGPGGEVLAQGPYGESAESLLPVEVQLRPPLAAGTDFALVLKARGYEGI
jgi:predicted amidohydrolase